MKAASLSSFLLILIASACVDRINFDVPNGFATGIVVDGFISDQQGPYTVRLNTGQDLTDKIERTFISAKSVTISDNLGNSELLTYQDRGVYQTSPDGIRGTAGRSYKLRVELFDGRVYESIPDTLRNSGVVDSVYYTFKKTGVQDTGESSYGFDIFFDASSSVQNDFHYLWKFTGTFQVDTNPEFNFNFPCSGNLDCNRCSVCNIVPKCSGLRNVGTPSQPVFERVGPCECCTCWYNIFNEEPIISDNQLLEFGRYNGIKAGHIPVHRWIFQHKVYAEVNQMSLSRQTFAFWKAIKDQKDANNSLFQPITGKIPSNFVQLIGTTATIEGLFYAASISSKRILITRDNVPAGTFVFPTQDPPEPIAFSCLDLYPHAFTQKPSFWED
jgi:hypothetical protein